MCRSRGVRQHPVRDIQDRPQATHALTFAGASSWLALPLFLIGAGQGIALPARMRLNDDHVETGLAGMALGVVNATLQISAAVSVTLFGGLFVAIAPDGASARDVQFGFAVASLAIGASLTSAAALIGKRP